MKIRYLTRDNKTIVERTSDVDDRVKALWANESVVAITVVADNGKIDAVYKRAVPVDSVPVTWRKFWETKRRLQEDSPADHEGDPPVLSPTRQVQKSERVKDAAKCPCCFGPRGGGEGEKVKGSPSDRLYRYACPVCGRGLAPMTLRQIESFYRDYLRRNYAPDHE